MNIARKCGCFTTNSKKRNKPKNPARLDPTRTTLIRNRVMLEMRRRFGLVRRAINEVVDKEDVFGIRADAAAIRRGFSPANAPGLATTGTIPFDVVVNTRWRFESDDAKLVAYQDWLKEQVKEGILEVSPGLENTPWMEPYISSAYKKGVVRAYVDTHAATIAASGRGFDFIEGGQEAFLNMAFDSPTAQTKLKTLSTRAFSELKGVTAEMDKEMTRILADGIAAGKNPKVLARELTKNVSGLEKKRALVIARTEIVRAHNEGQLDAFEAMNVEKVGVMAEWSTAADSEVCPMCQPMEGVILTVKEARGLIPRHPNCRCAWIPAGVGEHIKGTTSTQWAGQEQGLEPPGVSPTGKITGQVWNPNEARFRIRQSFQAEHPSISIGKAQAASRWLGADLTRGKISQKLKPGSRAYEEMLAAKKTAAERSKALKQAKARATATGADRSLLAKIDLTKAKYGLAETSIFFPGGSKFPQLKLKAADEWAEKKGVTLTPKEWWQLWQKIADVSPDADTPLLQAQMEQLDAIVTKKAKKKATPAPTKPAPAPEPPKPPVEKLTSIKATAAEAEKVAKALQAEVAAFQKKTTAGMKKWPAKMPPEATDILDHADYSILEGWGAPTGGRSQSYGFVIFDDTGRVLMREPKGHYGGAHWTFAKGGGTKPGTTALAELSEETGHHGEIMDAVPGAFKGSKTKTNYFVGKSSGFDPGLMDAETETTKWMTFEEAQEAIALSPNKQVAARDLKVLEAAFETVQKSDDAVFGELVATGKAAWTEAQDAAKKAQWKHNLSIAMTKSHYKKPKFGGGVVDADWIDPDKKTKLNFDGLNKVLSEKGWHATTLPQDTVNALFLEADDLMAQKVIIDKLKKAPKAVKAPAPVAPATAPTIPPPATAPVTTKTIDVPLERNLVKVRDLPGSTRPYLAKDTTTGKQWVVKDVSGTNIQPDHLRSEGLADELYRRLGFAVPNSRVVDAPGGPIKYAEFLEGGETLAKWKVGKSVSQIKKMNEQISKGFVADALYANHDVAGLANDNLFIVGTKAYRIDNGGALTFRAQGGQKRTWGGKVTELDSMRDQKKNPNTAAIYEGISDEEIEQQIRHIVANRQDILSAIDDVAVRETMAARIDDLQAKLPAVRTPAATRTAPPGGRRAAYGNTPEVPERVTKAKSNGVNIAADREDIEDTNMLVWEEIGTDGKKHTKLQFKLTKDGSDKVKESLGEELEAARMTTAPGTANPNVHPEDTYWNSVLSGAKTVSHHWKDKQYNLATLDTLAKNKTTILKKLETATGDTKHMLKYYSKAIDGIEDAKATASMAPKLAQYVYQPPPKSVVPRPRRRGLKVRRDNGINFPTAEFRDGTGKLTAGRGNRFNTNEAYVVDAGDDIQIKFIPTEGGVSETPGLALHGTISIDVPEEATEAAINKALNIAENLGVNTKPPNIAYEEALYLHRGVYLRKKANLETYKKIWDDTTISDEERVVKMKAWVKKHMSIDVDKVPSYDPAGITKHVDGSGFRYWERWDLTPDIVREEMADYTLQHTSRKGPAALLGDVLDSGGEFTSTSGRIRKGVDVGSTGGMSSSADVTTGGASYFFTRIRKVSATQHTDGVFFRPSLLARQDAVSYDRDKYGRISELNTRKVEISEYKDIAGKSSNETLLKEGVGIDDIDFIRVGTDAVRNDVIKTFHDRGVYTLPDGRAVEDIVVRGSATPPHRKL